MRVCRNVSTSHLIGGIKKSLHVYSRFRSLQIQRQQLFKDFFITQRGFPAVGGKDSLIEPLSPVQCTHA